MIERILEGIAAHPDDATVWEVLADHLLEIGDPGASLARVQLELFKGISNPELIGELAEALAKRPRIPHESYGVTAALWRCGYLVRLELSARMTAECAAEVLRAPAARGLHHFRFVDDSRRYGGSEMWSEGRMIFEAPVPPPNRLRASLEAVTPYLRRCSVHYAGREMPLTSAEMAEVLFALAELLPPSVERVDVALRGTPPMDALLALARRVKVLNLDGTSLRNPLALLEGAPNTQCCLGGTGLSPLEVQHERAHWLAPGVNAWLEHVENGVVTPLTESSAPCGFDAPSSPRATKLLSRGFGGVWTSESGVELDDGARLRSWILRLR